MSVAHLWQGKIFRLSSRFTSHSWQASKTPVRTSISYQNRIWIPQSKQPVKRENPKRASFFNSSARKWANPPKKEARRVFFASEMGSFKSTALVCEFAQVHCMVWLHQCNLNLLQMQCIRLWYFHLLPKRAPNQPSPAPCWRFFL